MILWFKSDANFMIKRENVIAQKKLLTTFAHALHLEEVVV
jgi:hypothetical protein